MEERLSKRPGLEHGIPLDDGCRIERTTQPQAWGTPSLPTPITDLKAINEFALLPPNIRAIATVMMDHTLDIF
jgi:hypothetical protein